MDLELFISEKLEGYMKGDVKVLMDIKANSDTGFGGLNFPLVLYVLSCMDYLGYLISVEQLSLWGKDTDKRILNYISAFFPDEAVNEINKVGDAFTDFFRNGLSHEYFPKKLHGISKDEGPLFQKGKDDDVLILNSYAFGKVFCQSVDNLINNLRIDVELSSQIFERMLKIEQNHSDNVKELADPTFISTLIDNHAGASGVGASVNTGLDSWLKNSNGRN
jgi:hypothetical protein